MSSARVGLISGVIATIAYSWAPFHFELGNLTPERLTLVFQPIRTVSQLTDLDDHFLLFACLAVLFVLDKAVRPRRAMLALVILAIVTESGQLFVAGRHAQIFDMIAHLAGATAGLFAGVWLQNKPRGRPGPHRLERHVQTGIALLATAAFLAIAWFPLLVFSLRDWDESFPLMVGDEVGGARAWFGEIRFLALYDRGLGPAEAARCFATVSDRRRTAYREGLGLLAAYDFDLIQESGLNHGPHFVPVHESGATNLPVTLSTGGPARRLTRQLSRNAAFSVEVWIRTENLAQSGPARIVTLSRGPWLRNFTLGQERDALVFRVRNPISGPNGIDHQLEAKGALQEKLQHVIASYDRGVSAVFVDGVKTGPTRDVRSAALFVGLGNRPVGEAVLALFCAFPLIACARSLLAGRRLAVFFAVVIGLALIPHWLSDPVNAQATPAVRTGCFAAAAAAAFLLTAAFTRRGVVSDPSGPAPL